MTTRIAIALFLLILLFIVVDVFVLETGITLETARKGARLVQSMALWR